MIGTIFLVTYSEFETARALGSNSPKNRVMIISVKLIVARLSFGNNPLIEETNIAVE
jgi:hypothetical protein